MDVTTGRPPTARGDVCVRAKKPPSGCGSRRWRATSAAARGEVAIEEARRAARRGARARARAPTRTVNALAPHGR